MRKGMIWAVFAIVVLFAAWAVFRGPARQPSPAPAARESAYADQAKWKVWQDGYYDKRTEQFFGYELAYPRDFDVYRGEQASGSLLPGPTNVQFRFPEDAFSFPRTNYAEAYLSVSLPSNISESACYIGPDAKPLSGKAVLNGVEFRTGNAVSVGAGQIYETRLYRAFYQDRCFELAATIHTGNVHNYEPAVQEFDKAKADLVLDRILQSFKFYQKPGPGP